MTNCKNCFYVRNEIYPHIFGQWERFKLDSLFTDKTKTESFYYD